MSVFATVETEASRGRPLKSRSRARSEMFSFIEGRYNPRWRHSVLGYESPNQFEALAL